MTEEQKAKRKVRRQRYYQEHKAYFTEKHAAYWKEHKEELTAKHKEYIAAHKAEQDEYQRSYREARRVESAEYMKQYGKAHRLDKAAYNRKWRRYNADKARDSKMRREFGIGLKEYYIMFYEQEGCCAICGKPQSEFKSSLAVDHNHKTGAIRGLLCWRCNFVLGDALDDIEILASAIKYLQADKMRMAV
jgi:hypothetical protein